MLKLQLPKLQQSVKKTSGSMYTTTFLGENTKFLFSSILYYKALVVYVHGDRFPYVAVCGKLFYNKFWKSDFCKRGLSLAHLSELSLLSVWDILNHKWLVASFLLWRKARREWDKQRLTANYLAWPSRCVWLAHTKLLCLETQYWRSSCRRVGPCKNIHNTSN